MWAPPAASLAIETEMPDFDEYEVRIYDARRGGTVVAAIEIVSPANKDRPEHRNAFVAKCAALLQKGVAVSIVDLVTIRHFNLYADLLAFLGHNDPTLSDPPPHIYATSCRFVKKEKTLLEAWSRILAVGLPLPTLPLWLSGTRRSPRFGAELRASDATICGSRETPTGLVRSQSQRSEVRGQRSEVRKPFL